jgi:hypothetical protein
MATSGRGSGMVAYNVQSAVDTTNHLIVAHEVTNEGSDRSQLANMAEQAKAALHTDDLEAVANRGYFEGEEIKACDDHTYPLRSALLRTGAMACDMSPNRGAIHDAGKVRRAVA